MRLPRPCLSCNQLHKDKGEFCSSCRTERDRKREANPERIARKKMLYGNDYRKRREVLVKETIINNLCCHICKLPFESKADITADHLMAGNPQSPLAPAHKRCNSSRGNKPID